MNATDPALQAFECAEEDSNLHPVIPDQARNPRNPSAISVPCVQIVTTSTDLDVMDASDDLDVVTDVVTGRHLGVLIAVEGLAASPIALAC
jgi:hypothetical protein